MQQKSILLTFTLLFLTLFFNVSAKVAAFQENPLTKAILLFDKGLFAEAEPIFREILDKKPDDFMVNYFYGACRTENGHYSEEDLNYLIKASKEVTPLNIDYYFGVQYHAKNQWEKALFHYKKYRAVASANEQEKVGLNLKMDQCLNKINPFKTSPIVQSEEMTEPEKTGNSNFVKVPSGNNSSDNELIHRISTENNNTFEKTEDIENNTKQLTENTVSETNENKGTSVTNINKETDVQSNSDAANSNIASLNGRINFYINDQITYISVSNFKTADGEVFFGEGNKKQLELQSVIKETEILRQKYKTEKTPVVRDSIGQQILELENMAFEMKNEINQLFLRAKTAENIYWQNAPPDETEKFIKELKTAERELYKTELKQEDLPDSAGFNIPPSLILIEEKQPETTKSKSFGVTYKIQLGAYSKGIPANMRAVYNKISAIRKVENYTDENGIIVYTTGNLNNYDDALVLQNQVRQEGIKDPKIAAYFNGKRITLEQAKEIEKRK